MVHRIDEKVKWTVCLWCGRFFYYNENSNSEHAERKFCNLNKDDKPSNVCAVSHFRAPDNVKSALSVQRDTEIERIKTLDVLPIAPTCESPATGRDYGRYYGRESKLKNKKQKQTQKQTQKQKPSKKAESVIKWPRKHESPLDSLEKQHKEIEELSDEDIRKLNIIALRIGLNIR